MSTGRTEGWGRERISVGDVEQFARRIDVTPAERTVIVRSLSEFPPDVLSRGMFFDGLIKAVRAQCGATVCARIVEEAQIPRSTHAFSLYAHRDFYKLFFYAAPVLHPRRPLGDGMQHIAETFYPVFRESMVGRTMAMLMGSDPLGILTRLAEAYNVSVQGNHHTVETTGPRSARWRALVEPTAIYPRIFEGIVRGTMRSHDAPEPTITALAPSAEGTKHRWELELRW